MSIVMRSVFEPKLAAAVAEASQPVQRLTGFEHLIFMIISLKEML